MAHAREGRSNLSPVLRELRRNFRAGGRRFADRGRALVVALVVLLVIALGTGAVVLAETIGSDESGYQVITGTPGADTIDARNGHPDTIDCGAGNDAVTVDRWEDGVYDCETVITP